MMQLMLLAIIQGLTEFLPISSSAHLIIPSQVLAWPDQGLVFDVAVHLGSLLAVLVYFARDLYKLWQGCHQAVGQKQINQEAQLVLVIIMATIPVALAGLLLHGWVATYLRSAWVIAAATVVFGLLLGWADYYAHSRTTTKALSWQKALWIGFAQVLALIPGTSRAGVTMTAGLFLGLGRQMAARFSFLLAIPVILLASLLQVYQLTSGAAQFEWLPLLAGVLVSFVSALLCIHLFLKWITRIGFWPFVLYRMILGVLLLVLIYK